MCAPYEILLADADYKRVDLAIDPWASAAPPPDRRLAHLDAELDEFAVGARRASERIGAAHPTDQGVDFSARLGESGAA